MFASFDYYSIITLEEIKKKNKKINNSFWISIIIGIIGQASIKDHEN